MTEPAPTPSTAPASPGGIARSTLIVMTGLGASIMIGLFRQRIIAGAFGTSAALDAYSAANGIPELLFTMLAGGALAFAFIPVYTAFLNQSQHDRADRLLSQVVNSVFILIALAAACLALLAEPLVRAPWGIAPQFPYEVQQTTAELMRILLLSTLIFAVSSIITGALHARQHFLLPAIAPSMYSAGLILGVLLFAPRLGIHGLAWGAVLGAALHLLVQFPALIRYGIRWRPTLGWQNPALRRVALLMAPRVLDLFMARASIDWINSNLGSGLGEGRVSALRYAFQLTNTPWTLIGSAIGIAIFPTLAAMAAQRDLNAQRSALSGAARAILTLAIPAAAALILFGRPVIGIIFEGGEFTPESTELVFYALQFYALALISQSLLEVVVRAFAAQQDTLTPLVVSVFTTAINVGLAITLSRPRAAGGLEHGGLALANGLAVGIEALIGLTILHFRWGGIDARRILAAAGKALLSAAVMAGAVLGFRALLDPGRLTLLLVGGLIAAATYFGTALLLGVSEIRTLPAALFQGLRAPGSKKTQSEHET